MKSMSSEDSRITHISDTALMTAACRAVETRRTHGWIQDPFAERLAGERGMAILEALPSKDVLCFGVGMRSRLLDGLVGGAVSDYGIRTVLSVGAGLDSRPWRIELPGDLLWIEADLPALLDYKSAILPAAEAHCRIERLVIDINDAGSRRELLARAGDGPALMITEGLLMYLPASTVESLAVEAFRAPGLDYWVMDVSSKLMSVRMRRRETFQAVDAMRAPDSPDGEQTMDTMARAGWTTKSRRTYVADGMKLLHPERLKVIMAAYAAAGNRAPPPPDDDASGVHLLARG